MVALDTKEFEPEIDDINRSYWAALEKGQLTFQACHCGHNWLPPRKLCPQCLSESWSWCVSGGTGTILSWVVYHVAYHPAFKNRIPYNVAIVELSEGPRLITNILGDNDKLYAGAPVALETNAATGVPIARFRIVTDDISSHGNMSTP